MFRSFPAMLLLLAAMTLADGQQPQAPAAAPGNTSQAPVDKRTFGVLPIYRTVNAADPFVPLTTRSSTSP